MLRQSLIYPIRDSAAFMRRVVLHTTRYDTDVARTWQAAGGIVRIRPATTFLIRPGVAPGGAGLLSDVQYRGHFHDAVVRQIESDFRSLQIPVIREVPLRLRSSLVEARADLMARSPVLGPSIIEVKTGGLPMQFTPNQVFVYYLALLGNHVEALDHRVSQIGLQAYVVLPPLHIMLIRAPGPGQEFIPMELTIEILGNLLQFLPD